MTIQSSVQIGDVIRNAVVFNVKNWLGGTMNSDSLIQSVQDFFAVLEQRKIDYVLVGPASRWQTTYSPIYSRSTTLLLPLLAELRASGRLTEVYSSAQDRIAVFRTRSP